MNVFGDKTLADVPVVVLDTETTGLFPGLGHRVVEVGAIRFEQWKPVHTLNQLVNPARPMSARAAEIAGITDDMLVDQPPFHALVDELLQLVDGAIIVAHNAVFDANFIGLELQLAGHTALDKPPLENPWLCTLQLARRYFYFGRNNLSHIAHKLNIRVGRAHRALNDVYMTAEVIKRMARELDKQGFKTADDILDGQGPPIITPLPEAVELPDLIAAHLAQQQPLEFLYFGKNGMEEFIARPHYATRHKGKPQLIARKLDDQSQVVMQVNRIFSAKPTD